MLIYKQRDFKQTSVVKKQERSTNLQNLRKRPERWRRCGWNPAASRRFRCRGSFRPRRRRRPGFSRFWKKMETLILKQEAGRNHQRTKSASNTAVDKPRFKLRTKKI